MQRLSERNIVKRFFNPSIDSDRIIALKFLKADTWKGISDNDTCPYFIEWPYLDVPSMLKNKLIEYYSIKELETPE